MGILEFARGSENTATEANVAENKPETKSPEARDLGDINSQPDHATENAHLGLQKVEAVALVWSKKVVWCTYAWIWVCFFLLALQSAISIIAQQTAFAGFMAAPAISTANILASIVGGVLKLPVGKILNIWGRSEGLCASLVVYLLGLIILASCNGPSSYAAGYVLYWVGYDAIYLILQVFIADTSGLRNRAFAFAFASTPFICTAFTGPLAGENFVNKTGGWRWAYGAFCIIMPAVFLPLAAVFKFHERKGQRLGLYKHVHSGRTIMQSIVHYFREFDVIGALLLMAGWILILLPFSLASYGRAEYKSATFIAMFIVGFFTLFLFAAWEKFVARVHFVDYKLIKKRTVLGACVLTTVTNFSFYCWDLYFLNFCTVVFNLSQGMAGYMMQIYNVGSCFWGVVIGIWMRFTKEFKYTCLCFAAPLLILGAGLMIKFRGEGGDDIGYVIMCQIFIAFGGGTLVIGQEMAVMAASDRQGVPMMLALIGLCQSLGLATGGAVQSAIYNNLFVDALRSKLPGDMKSQAMEISNAGYLVQKEYPLGSVQRNAVNYAWGYSQKYGCIAATAILALALPSIAIWKNYRLDKKQNKGTVL
ncbi:siderochrome iron transporter 2 [Aspergillus chevalieri]|uniref:Siderochrome iron transporter 2 n=1 Tax=Aspergillus chevalieri TaxID=182096 RepID=A0A7R7VLE8_ASPCH|nr:siderochrome iron transporter 2 [Aspergillus chevalieri]BCR86805.1 siderochrome iron transporter 2 [Aspergillus chevalieri]